MTRFDKTISGRYGNCMVTDAVEVSKHLEADVREIYQHAIKLRSKPFQAAKAYDAAAAFDRIVLAQVNHREQVDHEEVRRYANAFLVAIGEEALAMPKEIVVEDIDVVRLAA